MTIKIIDGKDMGLAIDTIILLRELFPGATYRHRIDIFSRRLNFITILEVPDDIKPDFDKISWRIKHGQEPPASPGNPKEKPGVEGGTAGPGTGRGTGADNSLKADSGQPG